MCSISCGRSSCWDGAGFFLILAHQRPDAKYLGDGIRDQFNFRVALGRMSELGQHDVWRNEKEFFFKNIKGRGYADTGRGDYGVLYADRTERVRSLQEIGRCYRG